MVVWAGGTHRSKDHSEVREEVMETNGLPDFFFKHPNSEDIFFYYTPSTVDWGGSQQDF